MTHCAALYVPVQHHAAPFNRLPTALLPQVLQHLPQQPRFEHAALVNSTWAAAAAAATTSISMDNLSAQQLPALQAWMAQHSSQLQELCLSNPDRQHAFPKCPLPCAGLVQLTALHLYNLDYQLQLPGLPAPLDSGRHSSSADAAPAAAAAAGATNVGSSKAGSSAGSQATAPVLPQLARLTAQADFSTTSSFLQLAAATALTHLELRDCWSLTPSAADDWMSMLDRDEQQPQLEQALSSLLQQLPRLQELWLSDLPASVVEVGLEGAAGCLTELRIDGPRCNRYMDLGGAACTPKRMQHLTALRSLHIGGAET